MRITGSRAYSRPTPVPKMPPGLVELMEGLTKDVLKHNPTDVYEFCANHVKVLLDIRDGPTSKRSLSLEQKIARAQEKVRRRAEDRRQKYFKEIKDSASDSKPVFQNNQECPITDKTETLKIPIPYDLNLANVSEVEIFHEPVENTHFENFQNSIEISKSDNSKHDNVAKNQTAHVKDLHVDITNEKDIQAETNEEMSKTEDINSVNTQIISEFTNDKTENDKENIEQFTVQTIHEDPEKELSSTPSTITEAFSKDPENQASYINTSDVNFLLPNLNSQVHEKDITSKYEEVKLINYNSGLPIIEERENEEINNMLNQIEDIEESRNLYEQVNNVENSDNSGDIFQNEVIVVDNNGTIVEQQEYEQIIDQDAKVNIEQCIVTESDIENVKSVKTNYEVHEPSVTEQNIEIINDMNLNDQVLEQSSYLLDKMKGVEDDNDNSTDPKSIKSGDLYKEITETVVRKGFEDVASESKMSFENTENLIIDFIPNNNESNTENNLKNKEHINENVNIQKINENEIIDNTQTDEPILKNDEITSDFIEQIDIVSDLKVTDTTLIKKIDREVTKNNEFLSLERDLQYKKEDEHKLNNENDTPSNHNNEITTSLSHNLDTNLLSDTSKENVKEEFSTGKNKPSIGNEIVSSVPENSVQPDFSNNDTKIEKIIITNKIEESIVENDANGKKDLILDNCEDFDRSDITNPNQMDLETAAITIQKVFRTFLFKSRASTLDDTNDENNSLEEETSKKHETEYQILNANLNKERRGITRMDTVLQTVNEEKSLSSTDDSSLSSAATTIQAHVRGFLVRNRLHSNKTSTNSLVNSDGTSLEGDVENNNKTVLNIHIVPEGGNYLSRDGSMLTSVDISLDSSPPSSLNLHPLGYDRNERKQLKREDAIQSISPPSNNSGKLSEDVDSVKEMLINDGELQPVQKNFDKNIIESENNQTESQHTLPSNNTTIETLVENHKEDEINANSSHLNPLNTNEKPKRTLTKMNSDEMDVVTPFQENANNVQSDSNPTSKLMHSSEFHDIVLPTKVSRSDTSVVREFKSVLVYFLLWNNS